MFSQWESFRFTLLDQLRDTTNFSKVTFKDMYGNQLGELIF